MINNHNNDNDETKKLYDEGQAGQDHKGNLKLIVVIMRIMLLLIVMKTNRKEHAEHHPSRRAIGGTHHLLA